MGKDAWLRWGKTALIAYGWCIALLLVFAGVAWTRGGACEEAQGWCVTDQQHVLAYLQYLAYLLPVTMLLALPFSRWIRIAEVAGSAALAGVLVTQAGIFISGLV